MRDLIRPTLFLLARLGLFFAVLAWVVGQWCMLDASIPFTSSCSFSVLLVPQGWVLWQFDLDFPIVHWEIDVSDDAMYAPVFAPYQPNGGFTPNKLVEFCGAVYADEYKKITVSLRHWLVATIFTAFNIILHFIYRKRPEVQPCEN